MEKLENVETRVCQTYFHIQIVGCACYRREDRVPAPHKLDTCASFRCLERVRQLEKHDLWSIHIIHQMYIHKYIHMRMCTPYRKHYYTPQKHMLKAW